MSHKTILRIALRTAAALALAGAAAACGYKGPLYLPPGQPGTQPDAPPEQPDTLPPEPPFPQ